MKVLKRELCCEIRKVKSLKGALDGLEAWIIGLRKEQSVTMKDVRKLEIDIIHNNIYNINPLVGWTEKMVWNYIMENKVPYDWILYRSLSLIPM